jgi:hypothetical protein
MIVIQRRRGPCFAQEPFARIFFRRVLLPHHLQGDAAGELRIFGEEHPAHAALAELVQHLVLLELRWDKITFGDGIVQRGPGRGLVACAMHDRREILPRR